MAAETPITANAATVTGALSRVTAPTYNKGKSAAITHMTNRRALFLLLVTRYLAENRLTSTHASSPTNRTSAKQ